MAFCAWRWTCSAAGRPGGARWCWLLGAASALLGIFYALMENDIKRLLAYSSVENIGIVFIGVGAGLLFGARGLPAAAALAFVAALYHALNHTAFKGLLFMGAGAVLHATHTRDMNLLGGLIKRMPWTALFFLIGAVAIAGLPPLNGFVSEWLLFQSLLPGVSISQPVVAALMTLAVGSLALTGGLAAAGFVKAFGITFLAIPRSDEAAHAHEVAALDAHRDGLARPRLRPARIDPDRHRADPGAASSLG